MIVLLHANLGLHILLSASTSRGPYGCIAVVSVDRLPRKSHKGAHADGKAHVLDS